MGVVRFLFSRGAAFEGAVSPETNCIFLLKFVFCFIWYSINRTFEHASVSGRRSGKRLVDVCNQVDSMTTFLVFIMEKRSWPILEYAQNV